MPGSLTSTMRMQDGGVTVALACARCGQPVLAGVIHLCQTKEPPRENTKTAE
jgi:hypothetical protein